MNKLFFLIFFLLFKNLNAQTYDTIIPPLTEQEIAIFKTEYSKMIKSEIYKKNKILEEQYRRSLTYRILMNDETEERFSRYVSLELEQTKFKTLDEALKFRRKFHKMSKKLQKKFPEYFRLVNRVLISDRRKILGTD